MMEKALAKAEICILVFLTFMLSEYAIFHEYNKERDEYFAWLSCSLTAYTAEKFYTS